MITASSIGIIADDLTGANDTALQFYLAGANTKIILSPDENFIADKNVQAWAIPTETRNISPQEAYEKVKDIAVFMRDKLDVEIFYKKIDSTIRGNIAVETLGILQVLEMDAAIIMKCDASIIKENDIIEYQKDNYTIIHRVIKIYNRNGKIFFITKGDNNDDEDRLPVTTDEVKGRIIARIPYIAFPSIFMKNLTTNKLNVDVELGK